MRINESKLDAIRNVSSRESSGGNETALSANALTSDDDIKRCSTLHSTDSAHITASSKTQSTLTDLYNNQEFGGELELISIVKQQIPKYKLRVDSLSFSGLGYENDDYYIKTPILSNDTPIDLSPNTIYETLKYFVLSSERLSQMTKTYNDSEVLTKLLEEKERDLELAARIGQSLLEQNKVLTNRNEELENELLAVNESVVQLKHELIVKNGLLQIYNTNIDEEESELLCQQKDKNYMISTWDELNKRVIILEDENSLLRDEASERVCDIENVEKKELQLISDCVKQLTEANHSIFNFQEEIGRKTEDIIRQQEEISHLLSQVVELQRKIKDLNIENETLQSALHISHECQNELSLEIIDIKEKYSILLSAFHELQVEFKKRSRMKSHYSYMPLYESLASEIESTLGSEGYESEMSGNFINNKRKTYYEEQRCHSPDSILSCDSLNSRIPQTHYFTIGPQKNLFMSDKLQIIKPLEGSTTLKHWQKLATPHLGVILERISGMTSKAVKDFDSKSLELTLNCEEKCIDITCNNFVTTCSIFTFTTTSLSRTTGDTVVTPSFSDVQLSTGIELSIHKNLNVNSSDDNHQKSLFKDPSLPLSTQESIILTSSQTYCDEQISQDKQPSFELGVMPEKSLNLETPNSESFKLSQHLCDEQVMASSASSFIKSNYLDMNNLSSLADHSSSNDVKGLGDTQILLNLKSSDGIITKFSHLNQRKLKQTPNSLAIHTSEKCDEHNMVMIKTLRKGGYD